MSKLNNYKDDLNQRYWKYQKAQFPNDLGYFERPMAQDGRPPVFIRNESWRNVIIKPNENQEEAKRLFSLIPEGERHTWYGSMNSSQALAQSVFGNLAVHNMLDSLSDVKSDDGLSLFGEAKLASDKFCMEYRVDYLGEPRSTSLDGLISGEYQVAIECKFTETEVGMCSRPLLTKTASNYERDYCDGTYSFQKERMSRCSLTERGVLYWRYLPQLFKWENDVDYIPCPLNKNYQLVRNILAAGVQKNGEVSAENGHVVLIYDERNPAFQDNGDGSIAYHQTRDGLREPKLLRKCSWQRITSHLRVEKVLPWLTDSLAQKYGL